MKENQTLLRRKFACSKDMLYRIWTEPKLIEQWYGPQGVNTAVAEYDFVEGGKWKYVMAGPDGSEHPVMGTFVLIEPFAKVTVADGWEGEAQYAPGLSFEVVFREVSQEESELSLLSSHRSVEEKNQFDEMGVPQAWESSFCRIDSVITTGSL